LFQLKAVDDFKDFWRRQSRNYKVFLARDTISRLSGIDGSEYWSIFIRRLGATTVEMGLISSVSSAVNMLLALPSGWLTDRSRNLKRLYLIGRASYVPAALMRFLAMSWPFCALISVWETTSMRLMGPTSEIISIKSLSNKDRVKGLSIQRMVTSIAGMISPMILALIITYFGGLDSADGIRPLFLIQFLLGIFVFVLLATQLQDVTLTRAKRGVGIISHFFSVFRESPVLTLLLLRACVVRFAWQIRTPFMGIYLVDVKGADQFILGSRGTVSTAITVFLSIPASYIAEKVGRRRLACFTRIFWWMGLLITIFTPPTHPEYLIIASSLQSLNMVMFVGWSAFSQEVVPLQARGRWSGINMLLNGVVGVIAPILGGVIWDLNPDYILWISLFCDVFIVLPLMIIIGYKVSEEARTHHIDQT
jgi:MFS family permease